MCCPHQQYSICKGGASGVGPSEHVGMERIGVTESKQQLEKGQRPGPAGTPRT